jgi:hypothetical protein
MAIQQRFCVNHPQRPAIGICVITHQAICSECSTRYEGVNYSKDGLRLLHERRRGASAARRRRLVVLAAVAWVLSPLLLYCMYLAYLTGALLLADLLQPAVYSL